MANVTLRQNTEVFKNDHIFHLQKNLSKQIFLPKPCFYYGCRNAIRS